MVFKISFLFFVLIVAGITFGDSLWDPGFKGYLSGGNVLQQGDIVLVEINSNSSLSFVSSSSDNKNLTFEFSGGEYGNLFSFLPRIKGSSSGNTKGEEAIQLTSSLATVVTEVDVQGNVRIEGSRNISIDGKGESLRLSGSLTPGLLGPGNTVAFEQLADARLTYTTLLSPLAATLSEEDIITLLSGLSDTTEPLPAEDSPTQLPEGADVSATGDTLSRTATYTLSELRKKELLILYINNLMDLIFD